MARYHRPRIEAPDANSLPVPPFATWVENRRPNFKAHPNLSQAKSALTNHCWDGYDDEAYGNGFLYEYHHGKGWVLVHEIHPDDRKSVHPLWNQYMIPEWEEPVDWQKKIKARTRKKAS